MTRRPGSDGLLLSLWTALTVAAAARAAVSDEPAGAAAAALFWALIYGVGLWYARAHDAPPPKVVTNGIAVAGLAAFAVLMLAGDLLQGLMTLVLWLQAARNFALRGRRDAYFALAIGLAVVTFAAAEARSGFFVLPLAVFGLAAFAALVYCHRLRGAESEAAGAEPAGLPAVQPFPAVHLAALGAAVIALSAAWYLLVPRPDPVQYGVIPVRGGDQYENASWEREARGQSAGRDAGPAREHEPARATESGRSGGSGEGGSSEQIDITRSGQKGEGSVDPNAIVMYVQAERPLYLRRRTFERFENDRWSSDDARLRKILPQDGAFSLPGPDPGQAVRYTVQLVSAGIDALPLSAHARQIAAPASVLGVSHDGIVRLPRPAEPGLRYGAMSILPSDSPRPVAHDAPGDLSPYLATRDVSARIAELARQVTAGAATPQERALALESHLRNGYAYSFETVLTSQGVTPLDAFLFETRRGHCEFFASAMAVMLRAVGVPSRVVHGYLAHNLNPATGFFEVRAFDGHAWVEAYIAGRGWMTFEPTAAYPVPQRGPATGTALFDLKTYTERLAQEEALQGRTSVKAVLAALLRRAAELWHASVLMLVLWLRFIGEQLAAHGAALAAAGLVAGALAAWAYASRAGVLLLWARLVLRALPAANVPAAAFRHLERLARTRRLGRRPGETADEYLERLRRERPAREAELDLLRRAFNAARYGGATWERGEEVVQAFSAAGGSLCARPGADDPRPAPATLSRGT